MFQLEPGQVQKGGVQHDLIWGDEDIAGVRELDEREREGGNV